MNVFDSPEGLPMATPDLLNALNESVETPVIRSAKDIADPFEAGRRAGRRELVDDLINVFDRQLGEQQS